MQTGDETKLCTQTPAGRRGDMSAMGPRLTELIDRHAVLTVYSATHDTAAAEARGSCPTVKRPVCVLCQQLHKQYHEFIMDVLSTHGTTPGFPPGRSCRLISPCTWSLWHAVPGTACLSHQLHNNKHGIASLYIGWTSLMTSSPTFLVDSRLCVRCLRTKKRLFIIFAHNS